MNTTHKPWLKLGFLLVSTAMALNGFTIVAFKLQLSKAKQSVTTGKTSESTALGALAKQKLFDKNVTVAVLGNKLIVKSDGIPNHPTAEYPNKDNPNAIEKQNYSFSIPLKPRVAKTPVKTPFGPIGVAINGIPFYNQYNRDGGDAVQLEVFDSCCGHPDIEGRYHYHKYPECVKSPFPLVSDGQHSPCIGFMFDGYAIYGPNGEDGEPPSDLDECNGHSDDSRGYHYHVTSDYPYLIGAYHGVPDSSNFDKPKGSADSKGTASKESTSGEGKSPRVGGAAGSGLSGDSKESGVRPKVGQGAVRPPKGGSGAGSVGKQKPGPRGKAPLRPRGKVGGRGGL